jgi:hypothetical protein
VHKTPAIVVIVIATFLTLGSISLGLVQSTPGRYWRATAYNDNQGTGDSYASSANMRASSQDNYSRISFDPATSYLAFPNKDAFNEAVNSLEEEVNNFKFDKGQTSYLLGFIRATNDNGDVKNTLIKYSPLSDEVLIAFLNKGFPAEIVQRVLEENIQFSEKVEAAYQAATLPREIRNQVNQKRLKNIAYNNPVLRAFENRYIGYQSLRKKKIEEETAFLATGADPESPSNPANEATMVDDVLATVLNKYREVKIGRDVYIALPSKDIRVADGNQRTLNYIRTHGDIPRNNVSAREPANGFPKASAPPPIDPGIEVEPNAKYNLDCGGVVIGGTNDGTAKISFDVKNVKERGVQYYWDFGDGFVSYKRNPTHKYMNGLPNHKVTVAVYNTLGAKCNSGGSGTGVVTPGGGACASIISVTGTNGLVADFSATPLGGVPPYLYTWDFGDGSTANTGSSNNVSHSYNQSSTYAVTVTITDGTGCTTTSFVNVTVHKIFPPTPDCDKRDKEKGSWTSTDNKHKFNHKFKLKNFLGMNSKLKASVGPHRKGWLGIWWPDSTACTVSMYGYVYTPKETDPCGTQHPVNLYKSNTTSYLLDTYTFGTSYVSVLPNSIFSTGTAYGGTSTLTLH